MVAVPSFVSANAKRGLALLEFAGDGLVPKTIREARQMAAGSVSADKVMRMAAWLARHESDLASPKAQAYAAGESERPTPGQVAWLLWGGDVGSANRDRARLWAERKRDQLKESGELDKAVSGRFKGGNFDTDLLPDGHPLRSKNANKQTGASASVTAMMYDDSDKGYGMEYKEYAQDADALQSLLNAYGAAIRVHLPDLAKKIMAVIDMVNELHESNKTANQMMKNEMTYTNPVMCLLHAYSALLSMPNSNKVRMAVMELIHEAEQSMYADDEESDDMAPSMGIEVNDGMMVENGAEGTASVVYRAIRQEGNQYCVYSQTGRSFGCYSSQSAAEERLQQIEQFAAAKTMPTMTKTLIQWHNDFHKLDNVSTAQKMVHDILEDEIELRGIARPYELTQVDKVDLILKNTSAVVAKADEQRYTLGPWYVPGVEDAHGEFTDDETLQLALWDWVRKGDRTVYLQHGEQPAGEMVEILTLPFPVEADLVVPGEGTTMYKFPSNTPFMGVVWEPWAWELVKSGKLRGYSIGGMAQRMEADLPDAALI